MSQHPVTDAVTAFQQRHHWWNRAEALDVLRATRTAAVDFDQFTYITNLDPEHAEAVWRSGRGARYES